MSFALSSLSLSLSLSLSAELMNTMDCLRLSQPADLVIKRKTSPSTSVNTYTKGKTQSRISTVASASSTARKPAPSTTATTAPAIASPEATPAVATTKPAVAAAVSSPQPLARTAPRFTTVDISDMQLPPQNTAKEPISITDPILAQPGHYGTKPGHLRH